VACVLPGSARLHPKYASSCHPFRQIHWAKGGGSKRREHSSLGAYLLCGLLDLAPFDFLLQRDEILNGKTHERNSNYFARYCFENGIELYVSALCPDVCWGLSNGRKRIEVIPDEEEEMYDRVLHIRPNRGTDEDNNASPALLQESRRAGV
jgi:hypothetical protein